MNARVSDYFNKKLNFKMLMTTSNYPTTISTFSTVEAFISKSFWVETVGEVTLSSYTLCTLKKPFILSL